MIRLATGGPAMDSLGPQLARLARTASLKQVRSGPPAGARAERSGGPKARSGAERGHPPEGRGEPRVADAEDLRK